METLAPALPVWAAILIQLVALGLGAGGAWAYLTRRRETDSERVARYEGRLDARLAAVERDRDELRDKLGVVSEQLVKALTRIDDLADELWVSSWREGQLVALLQRHQIPIPPELLTPPRRPRTEELPRVEGGTP